MALTKVTPQNTEPEVLAPISDRPSYGTRTVAYSNVANTAIGILDENLVRKNFIVVNDTNQDLYIKFLTATNNTVSTVDWSIKIPPGLFYEPQTYVTPAAIAAIGGGTGTIRVTEQN